MAGNITSNVLQIGDSSTASQNFHLKTNVDGTLSLNRGNDGASLGTLLSVDSSGNAQLNKASTQSMVRLNTANGYGSTNTKIRRFTNVVTNQGSDITYADSSTLGASFTINTNGVYAISYSDGFTSPAVLGVSINSSQLTVNLESITASNVLTAATTGSNSYVVAASWTGYLSSGDVLRPHSGGIAVGTVANGVQFTITRVA